MTGFAGHRTENNVAVSRNADRREGIDLELGRHAAGLKDVEV